VRPSRRPPRLPGAIEGKIEEAVGAVKNRIGQVIDNEQMAAEGKAKELKGEAKQKATSNRCSSTMRLLDRADVLRAWGAFCKPTSCLSFLFTTRRQSMRTLLIE